LNLGLPVLLTRRRRSTVEMRVKNVGERSAWPRDREEERDDEGGRREGRKLGEGRTTNPY